MKIINTAFCRTLLLLVVVLSTVAFVDAQAATDAVAPQVSEFDVNGMKVLIKRRPGTPTVAAGLFFRGGVRNITADNAGIEAFMLNAAVEGSKSYPRQALRKETSRTGTVISAGTNYDYSAISLASTKTSFDTSWQIFTDVILNPTFVAQDVERVRDAMMTALRSESDAPEGALEALSKRTLFAGHPYSNGPEGTMANIAKLKPADLMAYHRRMLETSRLLLVVVGDVEPETLQKRIAASFAKVPRGEYKDSALPPINFAKGSLDITEKPVQTNYVEGAFAAPSVRDPDYYAMRVAIAVLQTQVFQEVRVRRNLSYAPDAAIDERAANTASISVSSVDPNQSISVMLDEIKKIKQGSVDQDTINQMANFFLTTYFLKLETNGAQAAELAQYELNGGGWRHSLDFLDRMRKVTPSEVKAVANKYMTNLRFVVVGNPADIDKSIFLPKVGSDVAIGRRPAVHPGI